MGNKDYAQAMKGVDIFAVGKWNGDAYNRKDLRDMVESFYRLNMKVPLKLGHSEMQRWFGQDDGAPALGWIDNLYEDNGKLFADFTGVPDVIAEMMQKDLYRGKSAEIYWDFTSSDGKVYPRVLRAVALLGADPPAVNTLGDLKEVLMSDATRSVTYSDGEAKYKYYTGITQGGTNVDKEKELESKVEELTATVKKLTEDLAGAKKTADDSEARAIKAEAEIAGVREDSTVKEFEAKLDGFIKEGKVLPVEKVGIVATYRDLGNGIRKNSEGKDYSPRENLVKSLEARPKIVSFAEQGKTTHDDGEESPASKLNKLAMEIANEKKITYSEAVQKVKESHPDLFKEYLKG